METDILTARSIYSLEFTVVFWLRKTVNAADKSTRLEPCAMLSSVNKAPPVR